MKPKQTEPSGRGFWSKIDASEHHFRVEIPRTKTGEVLITENFTAQDPDLPSIPSENVKPRVTLPRTRWDHIAAALRSEFNGRCKKAGSASGSWQPGANDLPRSFGKELVVLAWAIEQASEEKIPDAIQNWLGLSPEERWWLYTQANAATGHAEKGRGKGWRKAIQIALTENPVGGNSSEAGVVNATPTAPRARTAAELKKSLTIG